MFNIGKVRDDLGTAGHNSSCTKILLELLVGQSGITDTILNVLATQEEIQKLTELNDRFNGLEQ